MKKHKLPIILVISFFFFPDFSHAIMRFPFEMLHVFNIVNPHNLFLVDDSDDSKKIWVFPQKSIRVLNKDFYPNERIKYCDRLSFLAKEISRVSDELNKIIILNDKTDKTYEGELRKVRSEKESEYDSLNNESSGYVKYEYMTDNDFNLEELKSKNPGYDFQSVAEGGVRLFAAIPSELNADDHSMLRGFTYDKKDYNQPTPFFIKTESGLRNIYTFDLNVNLMFGCRYLEKIKSGESKDDFLVPFITFSLNYYYPVLTTVDIYYSYNLFRILHFLNTKYGAFSNAILGGKDNLVEEILKSGLVTIDNEDIAKILIKNILAIFYDRYFSVINSLKLPLNLGGSEDFFEKMLKDKLDKNVFEVFKANKIIQLGDSIGLKITSDTESF